MSHLIQALRAEAIKTRRTFLGKSPVLFPFLVVLLPSFVFASSAGEFTPSASAGKEFAIGCLMGWLHMMQPFFALQVALLLFHGEHALGMWKHLNALPTPGRTQVLAKHLWGGWHLLLGTLSLLAQILVALLILKLVKPALGIRLDEARFWVPFARLGLVCLAAGLVTLAPLLVVAARFRSIGITLITGIFGVVLGGFLRPTDAMAACFPWSMGKVWLSALLEPRAQAHFWWVLPALACVVGSFGLHAWLQRKQPLY